MSTYSFLDCAAALVGPGGAVALAAGSAVAEEGITITATGDKSTMTIGADGSPMHSLHADASGMVTINLLKTSPTNALLAQLYTYQTTSSSRHGQNTIVITNSATLDVITCSQVAFAKAPDISYQVDGGMNAWTFHAGSIDRILGVGL
jgi:hypothetical protein